MDGNVWMKEGERGFGGVFLLLLLLLPKPLPADACFLSPPSQLASWWELLRHLAGGRLLGLALRPSLTISIKRKREKERRQSISQLQLQLQR